MLTIPQTSRYHHGRMKFLRQVSPRVTGLGFALAMGLSAGASTAEPARLAPAVGLVPAKAADLKLLSVTRAQDQFKDNESLVFYGLRGVAGVCGKLGIEIDGVEEERADVAFPFTLVVPRIARNYPKAEGAHTVTLHGKSGNCTGSVTTTFHTRKTPPLDGVGKITDVRVNGFATTSTPGQIEIKGYGSCRFNVQIFDRDLPNAAAHHAYFKVIDHPVALPLTLVDVPLLPPARYRAYVLSYEEAKCQSQGPNPKAGGWYVDFQVVNAGSNGQSPQGSGGTPAPGGGGGSGGNKPATGKVVALSVPGGSFAEDDPQKLLVAGQGGCALDLAISNKSYGGSYDQTSSVLPVSLDGGGTTLYNGTHFGTLAEGSYHATATGKSGCSGSAAIDFKVTPKTSTKKVLGKPTLGFDKQPKSGTAFSRTKDSNIWFKVTLPQSIKTEPSASCCDVEFDFQNEFGGWQPLPATPFNDSSYSLAVTQQAGVVNKSVTYFTNGTHWRMKVRAYKFKTEFEWSDWVEFSVDQN